MRLRGGAFAGLLAGVLCACAALYFAGPPLVAALGIRVAVWIFLAAAWLPLILAAPQIRRGAAGFREGALLGVWIAFVSVFVDRFRFFR